MKLKDIKPNEWYAVFLSKDTRYQDAAHEARFLGTVAGLPEPKKTYGYARVQALAVGVPYGKTSQGVRIEYPYEITRRCRCTSCGDEHPLYGGDERVRDERTNVITVHASIIEGLWEGWLFEAELKALERKDLLERFQQARIDFELRAMLEEGK